MATFRILHTADRHERTIAINLDHVVVVEEEPKHTNVILSNGMTYKVFESAAEIGGTTATTQAVPLETKSAAVSGESADAGKDDESAKSSKAKK